MHTRAVWKKLPDGNPRAAQKSRERDLNFLPDPGTVQAGYSDESPEIPDCIFRFLPLS